MKPPQRILVGKVSAVRRYPVKSMAGESLQECEVGPHGLPTDRLYSFVKSGNQTNFPWLTARDWPEMLLYQPRIVGKNSAGQPLIQVQTPGGRDLAIDSPELLEEMRSGSKHACHLQQDDKGIFDCYPVSLISTTTVRSVGEAIGKQLEVRRFRPNLLVEPTSPEDFPELNWVDKVLTFGEEGAARVRVSEKDPRCMMVNLDPDTSVQYGKVLKEITKNHEGFAGVYGTVEHGGLIRVGDEVWLEEVQA